MNKGAIGCLVAVLVFVAIVVASSSIYRVNEREQVIITQFGEPKGQPVKEAGLRFKKPFVQKVNRIEKRILEWDGRANEMPTKDKTFIIVDTYGRWQITDPLKFFQRLRDERSALSRLDDILGSETRNTIAKHDLIEVIRTDKDRVPVQADELVKADKSGVVGTLPEITRGRSALEKEIFEKGREKLGEFGIELLDVRFKRINYNQSVQVRIYERMTSERKQIAERFRSEGMGEAAKIMGGMEKELKRIESEAYKKVQTIMGEADATATEIYATAYNQSPAAAEFYEFVRTMELYGDILGEKSTVVLSTDSDLFQYLKSVEPEGGFTPSSLLPAEEKTAPPENGTSVKEVTPLEKVSPLEKIDSPPPSAPEAGEIPSAPDSLEEAAPLEPSEPEGGDIPTAPEAGEAAGDSGTAVEDAAEDAVEDAVE